MQQELTLDAFDYALPKELIAQHAVQPKDHSRLMVLERARIEHRRFQDIIDYLQQGDVLVVNNSKVKKSRIVGLRSTGSSVELVLEQLVTPTLCTCRLKGNNLKNGSVLCFADGLTGTIIERNDDIFTVCFNKELTEKYRQEHFTLLTPPYIKEHLREEKDYQTVYAKNDGSYAAPTAGLHFTEELLEKIKSKGVLIAPVCLHVGGGTFFPIESTIQQHRMHAEEFAISEQSAAIINQRKGRLIAVGTTSVRVLESAADKNGVIHPMHSTTSIFIYPGYSFKTNIDALITNFHLPKSTLLLLVSAYYGTQKIMEAYKIAVDEKYRFYSLGDAMFLIK